MPTEQFFPIFLANTPPQLIPIYDVVEYPRSMWPLVVGIILGALFVGFVIGIFMQRVLNRDDGQLDIAPEVLALEAIDKIIQAQLITQGKAEMFFTELSRILRVYIEAAFKIQAPDMTTEEFLATVQNNDKLSATHKANLQNFMEICDQIKFAKFNPDEETIKKLIGVAQDFVNNAASSEEEDE